MNIPQACSRLSACCKIAYGYTWLSSFLKMQISIHQNSLSKTVGVQFWSFRWEQHVKTHDLEDFSMNVSFWGHSNKGLKCMWCTDDARASPVHDLCIIFFSFLFSIFSRPWFFSPNFEKSLHWSTDLCETLANNRQFWRIFTVATVEKTGPATPLLQVTWL